MAETGTEFLHQLALGDETAFVTLIARYKKRILNHCLTFTVLYDEAEDLTQEIFIRLWQNKEKLGDVKDLDNYMFIVSRNYLFSYLRKRITTHSLSDSATLLEELMVPDSQMEIKELQDIIQYGIDQMPAQQQSVFKLSRFEGHSYEQIAQRLNISKSTVKWHIIAGLASLKKLLKNHPSSFVQIIATLLLLTL
jgi:RNA polymerase sigma-70 factor (ECF subfamily)